MFRDDKNMDDYQLIISIILLLLTQMFYINRKIGRLETKINFMSKRINKLQKLVEDYISRYKKIVVGDPNG
jgi:cell division protein FtsL